MYYIVGLGNPGLEYVGTRHNVGFAILEHFVVDAGLPALHDSSAYSGAVSEGVYKNKDVTILLPNTFMNASGSAVKKLVPKGEEEQLIVVYDDIDLPLGEIKLSFGRGDGGHNGVKSIIESLGTKEFARVRVGIAQKSMWTQKPIRPTGEKLASYVLGKFSKREQKELEKTQEVFTLMLGVLLEKGRAHAMNAYN